MSRQVVTGLALVLLVGIACDEDSTGPAEPTSFAATLNGAAERPNAVTTTATGAATVTINEAASTMDFTVTVNGIVNVIAAHIHVGRTDAAGPIVVNLLPTAPAPGTITGSLSTGTITQTNITTGVPITFASLVSLMRKGDTYVNVHTQANGGGEIRGQLTPQ